MTETTGAGRRSTGLRRELCLHGEVELCRFRPWKLLLSLKPVRFTAVDTSRTRVSLEFKIHSYGLSCAIQACIMDPGDRLVGFSGFLRLRQTVPAVKRPDTQLTPSESLLN